MNTRYHILALAGSALLVSLWTAPVAHADPLPGEVLKFQQLPINNLVLPGPVPAPVYQGHDELSTAYEYVNSQGLQSWAGDFMADDFADNYSTPIVHLKWWGSYMNNNYTGGGVQQFLIAFESDVPSPPGNFSHPGTVLSSEIVNFTNSALPGAGTFTEKLINGGAPEHLYQYNAELALPFPEQQDTIYWLKIVALTNDQQLQWGWHDRDYTQQNTFASPNTTPGPGESIIGFVGPAAQPTPVWHFQDDAVTGRVDIQPILGTPGLNVNQPLATMFPQNYIDNIDGPNPIGQFSKDLAFELYTIPEPGSAVMLSLGGLAIAMSRRTRRSAA